MAGPGQQAAGRRALGGGSQFGTSGGGRTGGTQVQSVLTPNGAKKAKMVNQAPLGAGDAVSQALNENDRQMKQNSTGMKIAGTVLGMMPAPGLGAAFGLGQLMNQGAAMALRKQNATAPGTVKVDPTHPGSVYGRINGMMYSTHADVPGYNTGLGKQAGATDASPITSSNINKKKKASTVLSATPLGTLTNPMPIA